MLTVIRKRFCKSGFQKRGTNQQALKGDLTHLEHLLNDGIKTKSGVVRTQVAIVFLAKGPSHGPCRKIAPGFSATLTKSGLSMFRLLDYRGWPRRRLHSPRAERMKVKPPSPPSAQSVQTKKKPPVDLAISP